MVEGKNIHAAIEALLFAAGGAVEEKDLAEALEIEEKELTKALDELAELYNAEDRGIRIARLEGKYQLCTKNEYYDERNS